MKHMIENCLLFNFSPVTFSRANSHMRIINCYRVRYTICECIVILSPRPITKTVV